MDITKNISKESFNKNWLRTRNNFDMSLYENALKYCVDRVRENLKDFTYKFPSAAGVDGFYKQINNTDRFMGSNWTSGFWAGMVWLAYEITAEKVFRDTGLIHVKSFRERYDTNEALEHHDIGFLYSLSCVAAYKATGDELALETALLAAKKLAGRFREKAGIIQRGGPLDDLSHPHTGVFIIDCSMNLPLLYWAAQTTGDRSYYDKAYAHIKNVQRYMVLENGATYQDFKIDVLTGEPLGGSVSQGANVEGSCWSRGQAWGMYGLPISYTYTGDASLLETADKISRYFLNHLQSDNICNWDFLYREDSDQRDTSAAAIAVCGMLELAKNMPYARKEREIYECAALTIMKSLIENYMTTSQDNSNAILKGGVYAFRTNLAVNEPQIWGDYYFMEALVRITRYFRMYW